MALLVTDPESALIDTVPTLVRCFEQALRCRGLHVEADVESAVRSGCIESVGSMVGAAVFRDVLADTSRRFQQCGLRESTPYRGIIRCLRELSRRGYSLALVSRSPRHAVQALLNQASLPIDIAWVSAPRTMQTAQWRRTRLAQLVASGRIAKACAYISDDPFDVEAARTAGLRSIFAGYGRFPWQRVQSLGIGPVVHSPCQLAERVAGHEPTYH